MDEWEHAPSTPRQRRLAAGALALVVLVGVGAALGARDDHGADAGPPVGEDRLTLEADAEPDAALDATPAPSDGPDEADDEADARSAAAALDQPRVGRWRALPASPLPAGPVAASAWTGSELLVWQGAHLSGPTGEPGGLAAYDPERDAWRVVADVPARVGPGAGAVWTGTELVVIGALSTGEPPWRDHAAAYRPQDESWRELAPPPPGRWMWETAVWNGEHVVVLGSSDTPTDGERPAATAYDPDLDAWEPLPQPPVWAQGSRLQTVALGEVVVAVGEVPADVWHQAERALTTYDPAVGGWSEPAPTPYQGLWSVGVAADPRAGRVLLVGAVLDGTWRDLTGTWTPERGVEWDSLPPRRAWGQHHPDLVVTDPGVVVWAPGAERGWLLDEGDGEAAWRPLPRLPLPARRDMALAWTGEELLLWGGTSGQSLFDDGGAWQPD